MEEIWNKKAGGIFLKKKDRIKFVMKKGRMPISQIQIVLNIEKKNLGVFARRKKRQDKKCCRKKGRIRSFFHDPHKNQMLAPLPAVN